MNDVTRNGSRHAGVFNDEAGLLANFSILPASQNDPSANDDEFDLRLRVHVDVDMWDRQPHLGQPRPYGWLIPLESPPADASYRIESVESSNVHATLHVVTTDVGDTHYTIAVDLNHREGSHVPAFRIRLFDTDGHTKRDDTVHIDDLFPFAEPATPDTDEPEEPDHPERPAGQNGVQVTWRAPREVFFTSPEANLAGFLTLARSPHDNFNPGHEILQTQFQHLSGRELAPGPTLSRQTPLHSILGGYGTLRTHRGPNTDHNYQIHIMSDNGSLAYRVEIDLWFVPVDQTGLMVTISNPHDDELVSQFVVTEADVRNGRRINETRQDLRYGEHQPRPEPSPELRAARTDDIAHPPNEWLQLSTSQIRRHTLEIMKIAETIINDLHTTDQFLQSDATVRDYLHRYDFEQPMNPGVALDILRVAYNRRRNGE